MPDPFVILGLVGIRQGRSGRYLQAHSDGELHASNENRHEEETWHLCQVDRERHIYALVNWRNHRFLSAYKNGCASANSVIFSNDEKWELISGKPQGFENVHAIRSVATGQYLGAQDPGQDVPVCGGEVGCGVLASKPMPPAGKGDNGWWVFEPASPPTPDPGPFKDILGVALTLVPVAIDIIAAL